MRRLEGLAVGAHASREFRRRLGALLEAQLEAPAQPAPTRSVPPTKAKARARAKR
jgi:hypothetical protein